ncbi:MAG: carboxypeptidase regulatory-like domain-containing protein [Acidimicrobiales bacterium]|nr:carboxypeptidase regulatory-like domain-containing protein [Acidimicrobiales bacterium]
MGDALPAIDLGAGRTATAVSAGLLHTCALLDGGQVKCWGGNGSGRLGIGSSDTRGDQAGEMGDALPTVALGTGRTAIAITAAGVHTCALLDDGRVKCWGSGFAGRLGSGGTANLGDGPGEMGDALAPVDLGTGRTATALTAGRDHTCALLDDGSVKCWGENEFGQLGLGDTADRGDQAGEMGDALPAVALGTGRTALAVSAGSHHTCALLDTLAVKCWGANGGGQLGLGDTARRGDGPGEMGDALPAVDLGGGAIATMVTAGGNPSSITTAHTCAALLDRTLRCWGSNSSGQIGAGDEVARGDGPGEMGDALPATSPAATGAVGGVQGADGTPVDGALVALLDPTDFRLRGGGVAGEPDGRFAFPATAGSHLAYAIDPTGAHRPGFIGGPSPIAVPEGGIADVRGTLEPTFGRVAGVVTDADSGAPVARAYVVALDAATSEPVRGAPAGTDGSFTLSGLPAGSYRLASLDLDGGHAPRLLADPVTGAVTVVPVTAGETSPVAPALPAQASPGAGSAITGRVADPAGVGVSGALVVALRAADLSFARAARSDGDGAYSLAVDLGDHLLLFVDPVGHHRAEWYDDLPVSGLAAAVPVAAPALVSPVLDPTVGSASGRVTDLAGGPVADAWVVAVRPSGIAGGAVTGADGTYAIDGLPPDNYRAAVVSPVDGVLAYWPDSPTFEGSDLFVVVAGDDSPVDAVLALP